MSQANAGNKAYDQLIQDHARLQDQLEDLKRLLCEGTVKISEVAGRISSLRQHLEDHFDSEESSGCFAELIVHAPRVSGRIDSLIIEHAELRGGISEIEEYACVCEGSPEDWEKIRGDFNEFHARLTQHERCENELFQEVFTDDIGSKD